MSSQSIIEWGNLTEQQQIEALLRPAMKDSVMLRDTVTKILSRVRQNKDAAVFEYTKQFDGAELSNLRLDTAVIDEAESKLKAKVKTAIDKAYANIKTFHEAQLPQDIRIETSPGVICEQRHAALEKVGLYIPGGSAPLPSTVLMLGVSAQVAGCDLPILCTPPSPQGTIAPEICYAAKICGIQHIYLCGGAQAIAAMAFGTETIPKVDKIFGPGNSFVTEAKQQVSQAVGGAAIDMPAGPSEVLVIADANADAGFVAADLLSQAEHGADSQAVLVSDDRALIAKVQQQVVLQLAQLSRRDIASKAVDNSRYILTESIQESVLVSNAYAPEHLIVQTDNARDLIESLKHAGSIFVGAYSPESAGDYASGTNHVLPTYGYARNYSSLGLLDFMRRYTVQELTREGLENIGDAIMDLADAEGLDAHRNAVKIRLTGLDLPSVLTQSDEDNTATDSASKQAETPSENNASTDDRVYLDVPSGKQP
ncbi:histidinol dehydrogenase [Brumicola nitratireducens]|uniref:Histidinol dehydrogenase n=1 Tax=Glaciecola nitratireducens (strain JCM 12485 / KCTC 12276 / FR1064) TaxID=1085623 RepID=G4QKA2_GLANF|nr:histidinol dehydrogenase [Glaciecola nitratireducens]AEP29301.1 histidinol dehydrogenase [Glaciecola nitratireducens FR1064]